MPSIILGDGLNKLEINGDFIRVDEAAPKIGLSQEEREEELEYPPDDILMSELPGCLREFNTHVGGLARLTTTQVLRPDYWYEWEDSVKAWIGHARADAKLIGWSISPSILVFIGLVWMPNIEPLQYVNGPGGRQLGVGVAKNRAFINTMRFLLP